MHVLRINKNINLQASGRQQWLLLSVAPSLLCMSCSKHSFHWTLWDPVPHRHLWINHILNWLDQLLLIQKQWLDGSPIIRRITIEMLCCYFSLGFFQIKKKVPKNPQLDKAVLATGDFSFSRQKCVWIKSLKFFHLHSSLHVHDSMASCLVNDAARSHANRMLFWNTYLTKAFLTSTIMLSKCSNLNSFSA